MNILQVNSSARREASHSTRLASRLVQRLRDADPEARLVVRDLTSRYVLQFLAYLEEDRGCSARTRNQRLAAIRAFARFIGSRDPAHVEWCGHIRAIASKKSVPPPVGWLTRAEMEAMLAVPDRTSWYGRRDHALLTLTVQTGLRVSELTHLTISDLHLGTGACVHCVGKGRKQRLVPLGDRAAQCIEAYLESARPSLLRARVSPAL